MNFIREIRIAWLTWRLRALIHDIAWAKRDVRRHIRDLKQQIEKVEQRLVALTIEQRNRGISK